MSPVLLIIRDGWGANHNDDHDAFNAVKRAHTPHCDRLSAEWPRTEIAAHGPDVGLREGIMGNSEVGHQNIGAGRIVDQEIVRIDKALETGALRQNAVFAKAIERAQAGGALHFFGLCSDAGVHAMLEHLYGLTTLIQEAGLSRVYLHAFTDGRDTSPKSGLGFLKEVEATFAEIGVGQIASVCGRFWAMDRDKRWERVQQAYDCLTGRNVERTAKSATEALEYYYANPLDDSRQGDEFVVPTQIVDGEGQPVATVNDGDAVIFFNFRGDRPRELTRAFIDEDFDGFDRGPRRDLFYVTMTEYEKGLCPNVLFLKPPKMPNILGTYVSEQGLKQFRCAETEKFPHVTFFINDYREEPLPGEERQIVPSPKEVATYDQKPEMSAPGVTAAAKEAILSGEFALLVVNYANPDMVGHTGSLEAAQKACETVDAGVGELLEALDEVGGKALITADHGNADQMFDPKTDGPHTQHTLNPVEVVLYGKHCQDLKLSQEGGRLADIAPTLLKLMALPQPAEMTGQCLIVG
ncbi:MAG: 2,3-bisphosphoglycerate-independent phosphoglycerate mutase [Opitutales bacterium]